MPAGHRRRPRSCRSLFGRAAAAGAVALLPLRSFAAVVHVPADRSTIQAGIDATQNGDIVLVADGVYSGAGNHDISFGGRSITVRSEHGPASCSVFPNNVGRGFVFSGGEPPSARLEGFTITRGFHASAGGGVYVGNGSPTLSNCIITNNQSGDGTPGTLGVAGGDGGSGAGLYVAAGSPTLVDCTITGNRTGNGAAGYVSASGTGGSAGGKGGAGGGIFVGTGAGTLQLSNCVVSANVTGNGGQGGSSLICVPPLSCQTYGENGGNGGDGGGILVEAGAGAVKTTNCVLTGNRTGGGGAAGFGLGVQTPGRGGNGAGCSGGAATSSVVNCTVQGNVAAPAGGSSQPAGTGGAIQGSPTIVNSILWGNGSNPLSGSAIVSYSDVQGGASGVGNLDADPQFVAAAQGNLRLHSGSPCIDAGSNAAVPAGVNTDPDGRPRLLDGNSDALVTVDQGAYENGGPLTDITAGSGRPGSFLHVPTVVPDGRAIEIRYGFAGAPRWVHLDLHDATGRRVRRLGSGRSEPGEHSLQWDRRDDSGTRVAHGVYWIRLRSGGETLVRKLILVGE